jgi:hypothetical protein
MTVVSRRPIHLKAGVGVKETYSAARLCTISDYLALIVHEKAEVSREAMNRVA